MNKKLKKTLAMTMAATMTSGLTIPIVKAEPVDANTLYKTAYEAVKKAQDKKTQETINEARKAITALEDTDASWAIGEFSKQTDVIQQGLFEEFMSILYDKLEQRVESLSVAQINRARELVLSFDTYEGNKAYTPTWSTAVDFYQNAKIKTADTAVTAAINSKLQADIEKAKELLTELKGINSEDVKKWVNIKEGELGGISTELSISSIKVTGTKQIQVTFSTSVNKNNVIFGITRDGLTVGTSSVTWNENNTVATIQLKDSVYAGQYTVTTSGVKDSPIAKVITAEDEKVSKISILSNQVPLVDNDGDGKSDDLNVFYKVYNQYGEDITKVTEVTANSNGTSTVVDVTKGIVKITGNYDANKNKTASITIINAKTATTITETLTAVTSSKVASVNVIGVYNRDGKTLTESTNLVKDKFYLEIEAKDQYGNIIDPCQNKSDILLTQSDTSVVKMDSDTTGIPNVIDTIIDGRYFIQIFGVTGTGNQNPRNGQSIIGFVSRNSKDSTSYTLKVGEGVRAASAAMSEPDMVAKDEEAKIPLNVFDASGNEIKDIKLLSDSTRGITISGVAGASIKLINNQLYVVVPKTSNVVEGQMQTIIVTTNATKKTTNISYTVKAKAQPTTIEGLDSNVMTSVAGSIQQKIMGKDLIIRDQYGRTMDDDTINTWLNASVNNYIKVSSTAYATGDATAVNVYSTEANSESNLSTQIVKTSTGGFTVSANSNAQAQNEKLTFTLVDNGKMVISSPKSIIFSLSDLNEFATYKVDTVDSVYAEVGKSFSFKVYGIRSDGSQVLLDRTQYSVNINKATKNLFLQSSYLNGEFTYKVTGNPTLVVADKSSTLPESIDAVFTVIIGNDEATVLTKTIKLSAEPEVIKKIGLTTTGKVDGAAFDGSNFQLKNGTTLNALEFSKYVYMQDQYGRNYENVFQYDSIIFSNLIKTTNSNAKISTETNGSSNAYVSGLQVGDKVTAKLIRDGAIITIHIVIVS